MTTGDGIAVFAIAYLIYGMIQTVYAGWYSDKTLEVGNLNKRVTELELQLKELI